jgi:hypothetical protein
MHSYKCPSTRHGVLHIKTPELAIILVKEKPMKYQAKKEAKEAIPFGVEGG